MEKAIFGAGCFWGVEDEFRAAKGVTDVVVGYSGGSVPDPTYEAVCSGTTGHAEVVEVTYDPEEIGFEHLLDVFWSIHDPTTLNRQGPDIGTQYRSAIFYLDDEQKTTAEASKKSYAMSGRYPLDVVTEITPATPFYPAEDYHQSYLAKRGLGSCHVPKA